MLQLYLYLELFIKYFVEFIGFSLSQHQQLFSQLQFMAHGSIAKTKSEKITFMAIESNTLLLSGAIVVATFSILGSKSSVITNLSRNLEKLIKINRDNILTLTKMLLALVIPTDIAKIKV